MEGNGDVNSVNAEMTECWMPRCMHMCAKGMFCVYNAGFGERRSGLYGKDFVDDSVSCVDNARGNGHV